MSLQSSLEEADLVPTPNLELHQIRRTGVKGHSTRVREKKWRTLYSSTVSLEGGGGVLSGENYQVLAADGKTIVCYHSPKPVLFSESKPLKSKKMWERQALTPEEVTLVRKLRQEDGYLWSVATLSRLFKTSPTVISRVSAASPERQKQLDEERELLTKMRPHKRKLYLLQRQTTRQNKIKELIATNKYPFPTAGKSRDPSG